MNEKSNFKVRADFYNGYTRKTPPNLHTKETSVDLSEIIASYSSISDKPHYLNVTTHAGMEEAAWMPCVSFEFTGNEYTNDEVIGGIKINEGFNCKFKTDTIFLDNAGYDGCIGFAWTNRSLYADAVPLYAYGANYITETITENYNSNYGLLGNALNASGTKGLTLSLYPDSKYEYSDGGINYARKVSHYVLSYRKGNGSIDYIEGSLPEGIDVTKTSTISVYHIVDKYVFYINGRYFAGISDTLVDVDTWGENEGFFTASVIASPYLEANLEINDINTNGGDYLMNEHVKNNGIHLTQSEKLNLENLGVSILNYYTENEEDEEKDYTEAFRTALLNNRRVYVPGGTYKIKGELVVRDNCELELAQDAVLEFDFTDPDEPTPASTTPTDGGTATDTDDGIDRWTDETIIDAKKCITLNMLSSLVGNHATIRVPYDFNGIVIYATTRNHDKVSTFDTIDPFDNYDPQWKPGRYLKDINITKPIVQNEEESIPNNKVGLHRSINGDCNGTAIFIEGYRGENSGCSSFIWGLEFSGLRIAGAFKYGVYGTNNYQIAQDEDGKDYDNWAWTNDMKINGIIDGCEIAVYLYHCDNAYISTIIQPRAAEDDDKTKYAKYGILLEESKNVDLSGSRVWDWTKENSLYKNDVEEGSDEKSKHQHIAMYGNCSGCFIRDHSMSSSTSFWDKIYYDNPASMFGAVVSDPKGMIPVDPKYAFYKNFNSGSNEYMKNNVTWRDIQNCIRYDVPIFEKENNDDEIRNNTLYRLGSFKLKSQSENVVDATKTDILEDEIITIEENNRYGLSGWSNLYFHISHSYNENGNITKEKLIVKHYWSPLNTVFRNRVPIYYYTISEDFTVSIYRLIKDTHDWQDVYNCKISITNAKRFVLDFKNIGNINSLSTKLTDVIPDLMDFKTDTSLYYIIKPELLTTQNEISENNEKTSPKLAGMFGVIGEVPVVNTVSGNLSESGELDTGTVKELVTVDNSDDKNYVIPNSNIIINVKEIDNVFYAQNVLLSSENKKFRIIVNDNGTLSTEEINVS